MQKQSTVTTSVRAKEKHTDEYRQMLVKKAYTKHTTGNESLNNETNNNGIKMIQFEISNVLNVTSTVQHFHTKIFTKRHDIQQTAGQQTKHITF